MSTQRDTHVELHDVAKHFGARAILDGAALDVARGEFVVVVGRSGSGKSTLLKLIGGLDRPDRGTIRHAGRELGSLSERQLAMFRRRSLGFVFQFFNLIPTLTVAENVQLPLALNAYDKAAMQERTATLCAELGLEECAQRFPDELSGGEQQRVAIARALAHEPALVIADEPTGNLDLDTAMRVLSLLTDSCRRHNTTLIMATHSPDVAGHADRVLRIRGAALEPAVL
jgi:putative ABC transport system ATP-binding protein